MRPDLNVNETLIQCAESDSGSSGGNPVEVQVLSPALFWAAFLVSFVLRQNCQCNANQRISISAGNVVFFRVALQTAANDGRARCLHPQCLSCAVRLTNENFPLRRNRQLSWCRRLPTSRFGGWMRMAFWLFGASCWRFPDRSSVDPFEIVNRSRAEYS